MGSLASRRDGLTDAALYRDPLSNMLRSALALLLILIHAPVTLSASCAVLNTEGAVDRSAPVFAFGMNTSTGVVLTSMDLPLMDPATATAVHNNSAVRPPDASKYSRIARTYR